MSSKIIIGKEFKSRWFEATAKIDSVNETTNECKTTLTTESGHSWTETWSLSHTKVGFEKGEYYYTRPQKTKFKKARYGN